MMNIGQQVTIQSFKHNGSLHRTWSRGTLIEMRDDYWVVVTYKTLVVESNKRIWQTREPAICFFYPDQWFNVIAMIRRNGMTYYCNIASPSLYDGEAIKNIDYDLDLKVFPNGYYEVLDQDEFDYHSKIMKYPDEIKTIVNAQVQTLIDKIESNQSPFNEEIVRDYYYKFLSLDRTKKKSEGEEDE